MTPRYYWQASEAQPSSRELIDTISHSLVATIFQDDAGRWQWKRYTSILIHGAPAANGSAASFNQGKRKAG
jgi:hypothetical protein